MGAAGVPLIGGAFQAGGEMQAAQSRAWQLEDAADDAERSALIAREAGAYNAEKLRISAGKIAGGIRADNAASGVAVDSISVLEVLRESHINAELDSMNITYGAELEARNLEARARSARAGAKEAKRAGQFNAFATLFGAGAKSANYANFGGDSGGGGSSGSGYSGYGSAGGSYSDAGAIA